VSDEKSVAKSAFVLVKISLLLR